MTKRKQLLAAAGLAALLVSIAVIVGLGRPSLETVEVIALNNDITAGKILEAADLRIVQLPLDSAVDSVAKTPEEVIGKAALHSLYAGQILHQQWLRHQPAGIAYPDAAMDSRLYTLKLPPENANGFWLAAGNLVDVHLVQRGSTAEAANSMLPEMLPSLKIVALLDNRADANLAAGAPGGQASEPLVCLAVKAAEARILAMAEAACLIKLVPLNEPLTGF